MLPFECVSTIMALVPCQTMQTNKAAGLSGTNRQARRVAQASLNKPWRENRLLIYDRFSGISFLVDRGSIVSILPQNAHANKKLHSDPKLAAANTSLIHIFGRKVAQLDLGLRRSFSGSFVLAAVKVPILGADFLSHYRVRETWLEKTTPHWWNYCLRRR